MLVFPITNEKHYLVKLLCFEVFWGLVVVSGRSSRVNNPSGLVRKATFFTSLTTLRTLVNSCYNNNHHGK